MTNDSIPSNPQAMSAEGPHDSGRPRIFVSRQIAGDALEDLSEIADVTVWPNQMPPSPDEFRQQAACCDGLLTMLSDRLDGETMDAIGGQLKVISNYAVGFNNIDVSAANERSIRVGNTPDVLTDATADIAAALLLAAARHVQAAADDVRQGRWKTWEPCSRLGVQLAGKTLGVIGMGRIGKAFAQRMVGGWGMKLLYTSRRDQPDVDQNLGGTRVELETLLKESDFVSVHVALTEQTNHLLNGSALGTMKESAVLINTARGEVIDQDALVDALSSGKIMAAGLDVTSPEPLPPEHPLNQLNNAIILPHIGSATFDSRHAMTRIAVDNLIAGLNGQPLRCEVKP